MISRNESRNWMTWYLFLSFTLEQQKQSRSPYSLLYQARKRFYQRLLAMVRYLRVEGTELVAQKLAGTWSLATITQRNLEIKVSFWSIKQRWFPKNKIPRAWASNVSNFDKDVDGGAELVVGKSIGRWMFIETTTAVVWAVRIGHQLVGEKPDLSHSHQQQ